MGWLERLYQTYEQGMQLTSDPMYSGPELMPICHTVQNAHIHITITDQGDFLGAKVEPMQIVLPATEKSAGRSGKNAYQTTHPLADKLQTVAGDYLAFGGGKSGFEFYQQLLESWCSSDFAHPSANAIYQYISKRRVTADLVSAHIVSLDSTGQLKNEWASTEEKPELIKALPNTDQGAALVFWSVESKNTIHSKTWTDTSLQQSWVDFDLSESSDRGFCNITGQQAPLAFNHPAKIRHSGDKAKLVSSNDTSGFTFRGRFSSASEAAGISFEATQKAHNALRWLLHRQAYRNGDQVYVCWAQNGQVLPAPDFDPLDLMVDVKEDIGRDLGQSYGLLVANYIRGYASKKKIEEHTAAAVLGLDSATPGRMSVTYYRETTTKQFLDILALWYSDFAWPQRYKNKENGNVYWFDASPTPNKIIKAAYGEVVKDSLKKNVVDRLIPSIMEGRCIPKDLVDLAVRRASNRASYKSDETWLWEQNLGTACALYRGYSKRTPNSNFNKEYDVALDRTLTSRDYLYGRLLAIAEKIESQALYVAGGKNRATAAARLMQRFSDRPFSTWQTIYSQLNPYVRQLQVSRAGWLHNRLTEIDQIMGQFKHDEFCIDTRLSGEYLLGYHCQRLELNKKKENEESEQLEVEGTQS